MDLAVEGKQFTRKHGFYPHRGFRPIFPPTNSRDMNYEFDVNPCESVLYIHLPMPTPTFEWPLRRRQLHTSAIEINTHRRGFPDFKGPWTCKDAIDTLWVDIYIYIYTYYIYPLKFAPGGWAHQSVGCPAYPPTKWYGDTYKMVAPMGVAAYKMVAPGYPTCPPTSSILG